MTLETTAEQASSYRAFRVLRVVGQVAFVIALLAFGVFTFYAGGNAIVTEQAQSGDGLLGTVYLICVAGSFIYCVASLMADDVNPAIIHYVVGAASLIWWVAYLIHSLIAGSSYIVPDGEMRVDARGVIYQAGEVAPRGFMSYESTKLLTVLSHETTFDEHAVAATPEQVVSNETTVKVEIRTHDTAALAVKAREFLDAGVSLSHLDTAFQKEASTSIDNLKTVLADTPSGQLMVGKKFPLDLSWAKEGTISSYKFTSELVD